VTIISQLKEGDGVIKALIEPDGHVAQVSAESFPVHPDLRWIDVPDGTTVHGGWTFDGKKFHPPHPGIPARGGRGYGGDINIRGHDGARGSETVTATLPRVSGLQLTPNDLYALGAVVAQWAIAEYLIVSHAHTLLALTSNLKLQATKLDRNFSKLQEQWKELIKDVCSTSPDHLRIGLALAGTGKILKEDRDAAAHWPGSRDGFRLDIPAKFVNVGIRKGFPGTTQKNFTPEQLFSLSENIFKFAMDVGAYGAAIMPDLFPQNCTWHGPRPAGRLIDVHEFVSIKPQPRAQPILKA
jgi:hypothetical protein